MKNRKVTHVWSSDGLVFMCGRRLTKRDFTFVTYDWANVTCKRCLLRKGRP